MWCCTVSSTRTTAIACLPFHLFSLKAISIPGMTPQTPCVRMSSVWSSAHNEVRVSPGFHTDGHARVWNVVQDKQEPQFVWLLCMVRIILGESKVEDEGGSCCQGRGGNLTACSVMYGERLFFGDPSPPSFPLMNSLKGIWAEMQW